MIINKIMDTNTKVICENCGNKFTMHEHMEEGYSTISKCPGCTKLIYVGY